MDNDSDLQIAGDILSVQHLLQPPREHPSTVADFVGLARTVAADRALWEGVVEYDATSRWYHRIRTGPGYEVWLLSWVPGQGTGAHDHGPSSGVLTVLRGRLTERTERLTDAPSAPPAARTAPGARTGSGAGAGSGAGSGTGSGAGAGSRAGRDEGGGTSRVLVPGEVRVFAPGYAHEVINDTLEPAVSLHIYFPGLTEMPMHGSRCTPAIRDVVPA
ncbi:cysteine dioxygenase [Streptomyces sp. NPDC094448]|uniref:cysteine dioxygenase n=1 Tax=Streptomyces sp. NPDC094448 TaxID=3366063 RepID=UPI00381DE65E